MPLPGDDLLPQWKLITTRVDKYPGRPRAYLALADTVGPE